MLFRQPRRDDEESDSDEEEGAAVDTRALKQTVLDLLRPGETPPAALQRLSGACVGEWCVVSPHFAFAEHLWDQVR